MHQAVQALACVLEAEAFNEHILIFELVQGVSDRSWRQFGLADEILLRQRAFRCQDPENLLCRSRQILHHILVGRSDIIEIGCRFEAYDGIA